MRRYLLSSILAALLNNRTVIVDVARPWVTDHEAATSVLAYAEVIEYIKPRSDFQQRYTALRALSRSVLPFFPTYPIVER